MAAAHAPSQIMEQSGSKCEKQVGDLYFYWAFFLLFVFLFIYSNNQQGHTPHKLQGLYRVGAACSLFIIYFLHVLLLNT